MASIGTICVCALIHQTLILIFRTLVQLIFSCVLIIADNHQNNYFHMSVKLEVTRYLDCAIDVILYGSAEALIQFDCYYN